MPADSSKDHTPSISPSQEIEMDDAMVQNLAKKLLAPPIQGLPTSDLVPAESNAECSSGSLHLPVKAHHGVLSRLAEIIMDSTSTIGVDDASATRKSLTNILPTSSEWSSLIRVCVCKNIYLHHLSLY
jgi:hypothetical protein